MADLANSGVFLEHKLTPEAKTVESSPVSRCL